jgi:hypothetical protein
VFLIRLLLSAFGATSAATEYLVLSNVRDLTPAVVARDLTPDVVARDLTPDVIARDLT